MKENKSNSLIEGNIGKAILFFVLPLIAGSLIQQLYVTVDAIIVGRFAGKVGLAAIDSINTLFKFPINFMNGLAAGATIIISRYFGAKATEHLHRSIRTAVTIAFAWESSVFRRRTTCSATAETDACSGGYLQGYADILHDLFRWSVVSDPL